MRIADSHVLLNARWSAARQHSAKETLQFWSQEPNQGTEENVLIDISEEGKKLQQNNIRNEPTKPLEEEISIELTDRDKEKIKLLEDFIYILTGKRLKFAIPKLKVDKDPASSPIIRAPQGWGLRYDYQEFTHESEKLSFSSKGSVKTSDGREIQFNLDFKVSREFIQQKSISIRAGDALLDPLVINFSNASASLGDRNYSFDIDCDGVNDTIAFTGAGSGFLALDLNGNNIIDNGSELFGPQTGNGFSELATYDGDGNGWIDENDEIFNRLKIWTLNEKGEKILLAIGQAGVGAIYLGNVQSEFGLKTQSNETLGQIRQTGIFLKETGEAGTIQHVDLAI